MSFYTNIYNSNFSYTGANEVRSILERTMSRVIAHAHLVPFVAEKHIIVNNDSRFQNIFQAEVFLKEGESYSEQRESHDLRRLTSHFRVLQNDVLQEFIRRQRILSDFQANAMPTPENQLKFQRGIAKINDFAKEYQYFLFANIRFISLSHASYDCDGRVCILRFEVVA